MDEIMQPKNDSQSTYYVGIGASAGGLEALQDFLKKYAKKIRGWYSLSSSIYVLITKA